MSAVVHVLVAPMLRGNRELIERYVPRLLSRDPAQMWTSGQWMTERTGGSDVGLTETILFLLYAIGIGLAMAVTAVVARRVGEGKPEEAAI